MQGTRPQTTPGSPLTPPGGPLPRREQLAAAGAWEGGGRAGELTSTRRLQGVVVLDSWWRYLTCIGSAAAPPSPSHNPVAGLLNECSRRRQGIAHFRSQGHIPAGALIAAQMPGSPLCRLATYDSKRYRSAGNYAYVMVGGDKGQKEEKERATTKQVGTGCWLE